MNNRYLPLFLLVSLTFTTVAMRRMRPTPPVKPAVVGTIAIKGAWSKPLPGTYRELTQTQTNLLKSADELVRNSQAQIEDVQSLLAQIEALQKSDTYYFVASANKKLNRAIEKLQNKLTELKKVQAAEEFQNDIANLFTTSDISAPTACEEMAPLFEIDEVIAADTNEVTASCAEQKDLSQSILDITSTATEKLEETKRLEAQLAQAKKLNAEKYQQVTQETAKREVTLKQAQEEAQALAQAAQKEEDAHKKAVLEQEQTQKKEAVRKAQRAVEELQKAKASMEQTDSTLIANTINTKSESTSGCTII